jgi:hypothetical protein
MAGAPAEKVAVLTRSAPPDAVPAFGLGLPASWRTVDLHPATRESSMMRLVEEAIPAGPGAAQARGLMLGMLRRGTEEAVERKAVLAALYSSAADGIPLGASLVASVLPAAASTEGRPRPDGEALVESLRATVAGGAGERHDLPGGPAVRVRRRQDASVPEVAVPVEMVQWFVLHPSGNRMAVLSFSTPNLALAEPFGEVFDAIAWSLQWSD